MTCCCVAGLLLGRCWLFVAHRREKIISDGRPTGAAFDVSQPGEEGREAISMDDLSERYPRTHRVFLNEVATNADNAVVRRVVAV